MSSVGGGNVISLKALRVSRRDALEECVRQIHPYGSASPRQRQQMSCRDAPANFPDIHGAIAYPGHPANSVGTPECGDHLVYGVDRLHAGMLLHFVSYVKHAFWRLTHFGRGDKMSFITKAQTKPVPLPPPGAEYAFARLDYVAWRGKTNPTELSREIGRDNSSWISAAKFRGTDIPWVMLRHIKKKYGVDYDWMSDGDEAGLTVDARKFLGFWD